MIEAEQGLVKHNLKIVKSYTIYMFVNLDTIVTYNECRGDKAYSDVKILMMIDAIFMKDVFSLKEWF
jgi:hypothetical protein